MHHEVTDPYRMHPLPLLRCFLCVVSRQSIVSMLTEWRIAAICSERFSWRQMSAWGERADRISICMNMRKIKSVKSSTKWHCEAVMSNLIGMTCTLHVIRLRRLHACNATSCIAECLSVDEQKSVYFQTIIERVARWTTHDISPDIQLVPRLIANLKQTHNIHTQRSYRAHSAFRYISRFATK